MRAFLLLNHLEIFSCNHIMFLVQFGINQHLQIFHRPQIALALRARAILLVWKIYSCLFIPICTRNHMITYKNTSKKCSYSEFPACSWLCFYMFFFYVDYSVYVIKIALFRISLFLSHIWTRKLKSVNCFWVWIKCFSKKKLGKLS